LNNLQKVNIYVKAWIPDQNLYWLW